MSTSARSFAFVVLPAALVALAACGGESPPPSTPSSVATSAGSTTTPPSGAGTAALTAAGSAGSQKAERRTNPSWTSCHASVKADANADVVASVEQVAKGCATLTGMHSVGAFKGTQSAENPPQFFKFHAEKGHCYRAYAFAAAGIQDLDLLIKDSTGAVAGEDSTDDSSPVALEDGAVCFKDADEAAAVVSVGAGNGAYAVQVWSD